jgi:hypothetical protein
MLNSALHHVAIDQLREENPGFYKEYLELVEKISEIVDTLVNQHSKLISHASIIETYDVASEEAVLQLMIDTLQDKLTLHIYILNDGKFVIGRSGNGSEARSASVALSHIQSEVEKLAI